MKNFEKAIGYHFRDKGLLKTALTHSSYANENRESGQCNERLEFLGDAVLQLIVSAKLFREHPESPEGWMSKRRASLVCEEALADYSRQIGLGDYLLLGKGEENSGGRLRPSIQADAFEAVVGALYLDGGMDNAAKFVLRFVDEAHAKLSDYKTRLQEIIQQNPGERLSYEVVAEKGPDHDKVFEVRVLLNSNVIGHGEGKSKKRAEQAAAREAMELMGYKY